MDNDELFITVASYTTVVEAEIARIALEQAGIPCMLANAESVTMNWLMSNAFGGVQVQVPQSDATRAAQVIERNRQQTALDDYGLAKPSSDRVYDRAKGKILRDDETDDQDQVDSDQADEVEDDEAWLRERSVSDQLVDRAFFSAVIGLVLCPPSLHLYSLYLLVQLTGQKRPASHEKKARLIMALALDLIVVLAVGLVLVSLLFRRESSLAPR